MFDTCPASPEDHAHMAQFLRKMPSFVSIGLLKPNPIKLLDGGLESVKDGLNYMREGKNSGEKLVDPAHKVLRDVNGNKVKCVCIAPSDDR